MGSAMTTAASVRTAADGRARRAGPPPGTALPTRQRKPAYIALLVALVVGLAALGAYWYSRAGQKTAVVVVVRDVPAGHVIERSDLSTANVAGDVTAIGASHLDSVLGQTAAVELLPNTLLQRSMVTSSRGLSPDQAKVGVEVKPGQIPADGLPDGASVEVLQLPSKDAAGSGQQPPAVLAQQATVYSSAADPSQSGGTLLTLVVPKSSAAAIAAASNAGAIALVQVGQ
jgi:SAF domain